MLHVYIEPRCDTCVRAEHPMLRDRMFSAAHVACLQMGVMRYSTVAMPNLRVLALGCKYKRRPCAGINERGQ